MPGVGVGSVYAEVGVTQKRLFFRRAQRSDADRDTRDTPLLLLAVFRGDADGDRSARLRKQF